MLVEYISYIATFIISIGLAVIGIMISYHLYQTGKKNELAILLYQQIFLFSFFIYGIWGNMALHEIISDLNLNNELEAKLAIFIPVIGIPFMIVSWFMLLKFSFNINGYKFSKVFVYSYFPVFVVFLFLIAYYIQSEKISLPESPNLTVVRVIVFLNLVVHFFFLLPFLKPKRNAPLLKETGFGLKWAILFLAGVLIYSTAMFYFNIFGFISTCIAIILLFGLNVFIPVVIRIRTGDFTIHDTKNGMEFSEFCAFYEISKRESEIVLEICTGKTNKAISEKLFITLQTVKDHTHRIYTKTGVNSRVQLANLVREKTDL